MIRRNAFGHRLNLRNLAKIVAATLACAVAFYPLIEWLDQPRWLVALIGVMFGWYLTTLFSRRWPYIEERR